MKARRLRNDELYHHGIKGQRWGIQNGPPYPLNSKKEYKNAKKHSRSMFGGEAAYAKKSKAAHQMANTKEIQESKKKYSDSMMELDDYLSDYAKKNDAKIESAAKKSLKILSDKYKWGYTKEDIDDGIYENHHINGRHQNFYEDELYKMVKNDKKFKQLSKNYENSAREHVEVVTKAAEKILGDYSNEPISSLSGGGEAKRFVAQGIDWLTSYENDSFKEDYDTNHVHSFYYDNNKVGNFYYKKN